jgi:hypothetical protein
MLDTLYAGGQTAQAGSEKAQTGEPRIATVLVVVQARLQVFHTCGAWFQTGLDC